MTAHTHKHTMSTQAELSKPKKCVMKSQQEAFWHCPVNRCARSATYNFISNAVSSDSTWIDSFGCWACSKSIPYRGVFRSLPSFFRSPVVAVGFFNEWIMWIDDEHGLVCPNGCEALWRSFRSASFGLHFALTGTRENSEATALCPN